MSTIVDQNAPSASVPDSVPTFTLVPLGNLVNDERILSGGLDASFVGKNIASAPVPATTSLYGCSHVRVSGPRSVVAALASSPRPLHAGTARIAARGSHRAILDTSL